MPKIDLLKALQELPPGRELDTADYYLEHREYNKGSLANVLTSQFTISIKGVATATINVWRLAGIDYTVNSRTTHLDGDKTFADAVAIVGQKIIEHPCRVVRIGVLEGAVPRSAVSA